MTTPKPGGRHDPSLAKLDALWFVDRVRYYRLACRFAEVVERLPQDRDHEDMREHVMALDAELDGPMLPH